MGKGARGTQESGAGRTTRETTHGGRWMTGEKSHRGQGSGDTEGACRARDNGGGRMMGEEEMWGIRGRGGKETTGEEMLVERGLCG